MTQKSKQLFRQLSLKKAKGKNAGYRIYYYVESKTKIANTAISRDVGEALATYQIPALAASITQRVIFAEAAAQGLAVHEIDPKGAAAAEIDALTAELMEFVK